MEPFHLVRAISLDSYEVVVSDSREGAIQGDILLALGDIEIQDGDAVLLELIPNNLRKNPDFIWISHMQILPDSCTPLAVVRDGKIIAINNPINFLPQEVSAKLAEKLY